MEHRETLCKSNIKYAKITLKKRQQLVKEVLENNQLISKAAKRLNIRLSTAKLIIKRYKQEGTFFESKIQKSKRLGKDEYAAKQSNQQGISPIKQKLQNSSAENCNIANSDAVRVPQLFYYENPWIQLFPFSLPIFQGMMFYPF